MEGSLSTLVGVAESMENLGGSAENGSNVLTRGGTRGVVTSLNVFLNVELNIGLGVLIDTSFAGKIFLIVDGDTLCVWGSKILSSSISLSKSSSINVDGL